jgi:hypothetical protein
MTDAIQIQFIKQHGHATQMHFKTSNAYDIYRRNMTENDFGKFFVIKVDLLFDTYHELSSVVSTRATRWMLAMSVFLAISLPVLIVGANNVSSYAFIPLSMFCFCMCMSFFNMFAEDWYRHSLENNIRKECAKLTNCTALATFHLIMVDDGITEWFSHIDVIIADS